MKKINQYWNLTLCIALGLILALLSLPLYSEENTAQMTGEGTAAESSSNESAVSESIAGESTTGESASGESTATETTGESPAENTEQSATTAAPAEVPAKAPPKSKLVLRALLTTAIQDREPVDEIVSINKNQERIYFFTEFTDLKGKSIKHRWEYNGKIMGEVNFNVGSNKWRCYSSKNLLPEWTGIWTVSVIDENNNVLAETYFEVTE